MQGYAPNRNTCSPHERQESRELGPVCRICDLPDHTSDDSDVPVEYPREAPAIGGSAMVSFGGGPSTTSLRGQ